MIVIVVVVVGLGGFG
jgi:hypothetical protein